MTCSNAGHEYPFIRGKDGAFHQYEDKHGFVVGGLKKMKYTDYELMLKPGDAIFVYTDGVPEASNTESEFYGMEHLEQALNHKAGLTPQEILKTVRQDVDQFVGGGKQFDDLTMLFLEYRVTNRLLYEHIAHYSEQSRLELILCEILCEIKSNEELEMKKIDMIVFPSDYFDRSKVDPDLKSEYDAVRSTGLYRVAIFSYPSWFDQEKLILNEEPEEEVTAVYRGWMMKPEMYQAFHQQLIAHKIRLITTPVQYEKMHVFPNVYEDVKDDTAKMEIFPLHEQIDVEQLKKAFSRFMVKDYVKSVKGTEFPKFFDQSVRQEEFDHWMEVFYKYRGDLLTGGICIKEYLDLKRYGEQTSEFRVFYINHEIATICRNSGQADYVPQPPPEGTDREISESGELILYRGLCRTGGWFLEDH